MSAIHRFDVCVVGGGPAGSALATRLAQLGHRVCLIERAAFPRRHVGESLSPGIWSQLDVLGAADLMEPAGFRLCHGAVLRWSTAVDEHRSSGPRPSLLVDRGRFDALLLDVARAHGVYVWQPAALRRRERRADGWRLGVEVDGRRIEIAAAVLADASGRSRMLRGRKQITGRSTIALYGYWRGAALPDTPKIEAGDAEWSWGIPLPDGTYNTMIFLDRDDRRMRRADALDAGFERLVARSSLLADARDARLRGPVRAADATPYVDEDSIGPTWIKVGEAALALDPLSSTGVQKAIQTSFAGAVAVNTWLRRPERGEAATSFYRNHVIDAADRHRRWAAEFYGQTARGVSRAFWRARATTGPAEAPPMPPVDLAMLPLRTLRVELSAHAEFVDRPCLAGDFVAVKTALRHPCLDQPVVFLDRWELAPLLRQVKPGMTVLELMRGWPADMPAESRPPIAGWLLRNRVLVAESAGREPAAAAPVLHVA